jgi:hypothetical protein
VKAYLEASKKEIATTIFALKSTMITNHTNLKKRFDLLLTLGKNSIDLVTEVKSEGNTGVVNLTNLIKAKQKEFLGLRIKIKMKEAERLLSVHL